MKSIQGGIGKAKKPARGAAPKHKAPAKAAPVASKFRVLAVVKDRASGRPIGGAHYEVAKKGAEAKVLAKGSTAVHGTVDAPVASAGSYVVRVKGVAGRPPAPAGKPLAVGAIAARPAASKAKATPVLIAPHRGLPKKPNPKNRKPGAKKKKDDDKAMKHLQLAWGK